MGDKNRKDVPGGMKHEPEDPYLPPTRPLPQKDPYLPKTDLEKGFMALIRAVARPNGE